MEKTVAEIRHYVPILKHLPAEPVTQQVSQLLENSSELPNGSSREEPTAVAGEHPGSARTDWGSRRSWVDPRCFLVPLSSFVNLLCQL